MGIDMPAEVEEAASNVHNNGFAAKAGGNTFSTDFPLLPSNGKIKAGKEICPELNGIMVAEDHVPPQEHSSTAEEVPMTVETQDGSSSSSNGDDEGVPESDFEVKVNEAAPLEIKAENGDLHIGGAADEPAEFSNGDTGQKEAEAVFQNVNAGWIPADAANSGWEVADDQSVLGPGPLATEESKTAAVKPAAAKELHTFYMIRIPKPADHKTRTEIKVADQLFKDKSERRDSVNNGFKLKRTSRQEALEKLKAARERVWGYVDAIRSKRDEIEPLQAALKKIRETGKLAREKSRDLPASEQELDERIAYFEYRIQHESIPLKEEKQLLRDIKNLKSRREEVCSNEAFHADFVESLSERDEIFERIKPLQAEVDALKAECAIASEQLRIAEAEFEKTEEALHHAQSQWAVANQARQDAYEARAVLHKESNARNDEFFKNKWEINNVRQLAYKKDKKTVEETCNAQVERVMSLWNSDDEFRAAYVKANEKSTLKRLQTFDGRALGPGEEPPVLPADPDDVDTVTEAPVVVAAVSRKEDRQVKVKPAEPNHVPVHSSLDGQRKDPDLQSTLVVERDIQSSSKNTSSSPDAASISEQERAKEDAAVAAELKEKRRQQEMAKAKEAEERKKRLAERAQSKALARAQKEAERREKEKEKKARKKAASLAASQGTIAPEVGGEELPGIESESNAHVQDVPAESKPSPRQRRKQVPQKSKTIVKTPVPLLSKKDGIHQKPWLWIVIGLIILLGFLGLLARFLI